MKTVKKFKWLFITLFLILFIYLVGVVVFSMIAMPNTVVNGENVSFKPKDGIFEYKKAPTTYELLGRNHEKLEIKEKDLQLNREIPNDASLHDNPWIWPASFFTKNKVDIRYQINYNKKKLNQMIADSNFDFNGKDPVDAHLIVSGKQVKIEKEKLGTKVNEEELRKAVDSELRKVHKDGDQIELTGIYYEPKIHSGDKVLQAQMNEVNRVLQMDITYDFKDRQFHLSGENLFKVYDLKNDGTISLNRDRVEDWVTELAKNTDTYGTTRKFNATDLGAIEVPPGIYGWQINVKKTTDELMNLLQKGKSAKVEPEYTVAGLHREKNDIGNTYVEIDLSRQHLWAYKDGKLLLDSDIVSGLAEKQYATPVGVNCFWTMEQDQLLQGKNFDGLSEYQTPVAYWMAINYGGVGLHDAPWRSSFGGNIYQTNGSHGCVNLPPDVAKAIFENYDNLTPVIVYESSTSNSPLESTY